MSENADTAGSSRKKKRDDAGMGDEYDDVEMSDQQQEQMMTSQMNRKRGPDFMHNEEISESTFRDRYRTVDDDDEVCRCFFQLIAGAFVLFEISSRSRTLCRAGRRAGR